jgi:hypothetical protein
LFHREFQGGLQHQKQNGFDAVSLCGDEQVEGHDVANLLHQPGTHFVRRGGHQRFDAFVLQRDQQFQPRVFVLGGEKRGREKGGSYGK